MNKKISFFKMFVLSSFLLGGIEVVQANNQYRYYDDESLDPLVNRFNILYNETLENDSQQNIDNLDEFCNKYHGSIVSQIRIKYMKGQQFSLYFKIIKKWTMYDLFLALDEYYKYKKCDYYKRDVLAKFFLGGKKDIGSHYSGMCSLIDGVKYTYSEYFAGRGSVVENDKTYEDSLVESDYEARDYLHDMLVFAVVSAFLSERPVDLWGVIVTDFDGGCEAGKRTRLIGNMIKFYEKNKNINDWDSSEIIFLEYLKRHVMSQRKLVKVKEYNTQDEQLKDKKQELIFEYKESKYAYNNRKEKRDSYTSIRNAQNNVIEELDGYCKRINNIVRSGDKDRKHKLTNMYHEFLDKYSDYIEPQDRLNEDDGIQDFYDNFIELITKVQNALR